MREYGSEHPAIVLPDGYFESMEEYGREVLFMRSGREAFAVGSNSCFYRKRQNDTLSCLLLLVNECAF